MSSRSIVIVLLLAVILGSLFLLTREGIYTSQSDMPEAVARLTQISTESVDEIRFQAGEDELVVARSGDGWVLPGSHGMAAKSEKVDQFLEAVRELTDAEERARSAKNHERFEVAGDKARHVALVGRGTGLPAKFVVGKRRGGVMPGHFLLIPGSDTVYAVRGELLSRGSLYSGELRPRDWLDLTIFKSPEDKPVEEITMESDGQRIVVERKPEVEGEESDLEEHERWRVVEPEQFDANADTMQSLLSATRQLQGDDAGDPAKIGEYGIENPLHRVELVFGDEVIDLRFGVEEMKAPEEAEEAEGPRAAPEREGTGRFYMQRVGTTHVYLVRGWRRDRLFKELDELRPVIGEGLPDEPDPGPPREPGDNAGSGDSSEG